MSKFLLFCKRTRVFIKFRFLIYKFQLLKFLGKFIPYFKPMIYTEEDIRIEISKNLKEYIESFNKMKITCKIDEGEYLVQNLDAYSCKLKYEVEYAIPSLPLLKFSLFIESYTSVGITNLEKPKHLILIPSSTDQTKTFFEFIEDINPEIILSSIKKWNKNNVAFTSKIIK